MVIVCTSSPSAIYVRGCCRNPVIVCLRPGLYPNPIQTHSFLPPVGFPTGMPASPAVLLLIVFVFLISSMSSPPHASSPQPCAASENLLLSFSVDEEVSDISKAEGLKQGGRALAAFGLGVSESARQVPTGLNSLHHNHNPITKPKQDVHAVIASHP